MGHDNWGGTEVPAQIATMYESVAGLTEAGLAPGDAGWTAGKWTPYNFAEEVQRLWDDGTNTSPYANAILHDPNPELDEALARLEDADALLQMFDPETDWETLFDTVKAKIESDLVWEDDIDAVVDAFDTANLPALQRAIARQQANICERGGAFGTGFHLAAATLQKGHTDQVAKYRAEMTLEAKKLRATAITTAISQLLDAIRYRIEANRIMSQTRMDFAKANITANSDLVANQLKVDVEADRWNMNLLGEVKSTNIIGGSPSLQKGLEPWQASLSLILNAAGGAMNLIPALM